MEWSQESGNIWSEWRAYEFHDRVTVDVVLYFGRFLCIFLFSFGTCTATCF